MESFVEVVIASQAVFGSIFLLFIEEAGIPLPIPGDVFVTYTGYRVINGDIPYFLAFVILLSAVMIGSSILYYISFRFGQVLIDKYAHILHLTPERLLYVEKKFKVFGPWVIIFGRHIPGFRLPITVFAGMSKMPFKSFFWSSFLSTVPWVLFNLQLGMRMGPRVGRLFKPSMESVIIMIFLLLAVVLFGFKRAADKKKLTK